MAVRVTGSGPSELKLLAAKVRAADPALKRDLRRGLRDAAAAAADRAQAAILAMPSHHDGTLRGEIAATVSVSTRISQAGITAEIVSAGAKMPPGKTNLPVYANREKGWMHPVYGRAEAEIAAHMAAGAVRTGRPGRRPAGVRSHGRGWTWVRQVAKPGWFDASVALAGPDAQRACQQVIDGVKRRLGG